MPTWPAEQIPELYPENTLADMRSELKRILDDVAVAKKQHPKATFEEKREILKAICKKHAVTFCEKVKDRLEIFIFSSIAPELDSGYEIIWDDPKPRNLDSDWQA